MIQMYKALSIFPLKAINGCWQSFWDRRHYALGASEVQVEDILCVAFNVYHRDSRARMITMTTTTTTTTTMMTMTTMTTMMVTIMTITMIRIRVRIMIRVRIPIVIVIMVVIMMLMLVVFLLIMIVNVLEAQSMDDSVSISNGLSIRAAERYNLAYVRAIPILWQC